MGNCGRTTPGPSQPNNDEKDESPDQRENYLDNPGQHSTRLEISVPAHHRIVSDSIFTLTFRGLEW